MHTSPKVSIIIPVYNTEMYIEQAINSILEQTLSDIEVIAINDGSTDNSLTVIDKIAKKDKRIKSFTQKNQGQAIARTHGLKYAKGEYIYFMDSDDLLTKEALASCYNKCNSQLLDFVFFDAESFTEENVILSEKLDYHRTHGLIDKVYSGIEILELQLKEYAFKAPVWLNFISRRYIEKHNIHFNPLTSPHEDQLFTFYLYINAKKVGFIPQVFFKRRLRKNSVMTTKYAWKNISKYLIIADELIIYQKDKNEKIKEMTELFLTQMISAAVWSAHVFNFKERVRIFLFCQQKYRKYVAKKVFITLFFKKYFKGNSL